MHFERQYFSATLLNNGDVLVAGGFSNCDDDFCYDNRQAELYDPAKGTWSVTGSMHEAREQFTATLLTNGEVLVAGGLNEGGSNGNETSYAEAELYNPKTRDLDHDRLHVRAEVRAGCGATAGNGLGARHRREQRRHQ